MGRRADLPDILGQAGTRRKDATAVVNAGSRSGAAPLFPSPLSDHEPKLCGAVATAVFFFAGDRLSTMGGNTERMWTVGVSYLCVHYGLSGRAGGEAGWCLRWLVDSLKSEAGASRSMYCSGLFFFQLSGSGVVLRCVMPLGQDRTCVGLYHPARVTIET